MTRPHLPDSIEARAERRVRRKLGFYIHALVFVVINAWLIIVRGRDTIIWGWAFGLLIHALFTVVTVQGEGVRERMLRREIERMRRERDGSSGGSGDGKA